MVITFCAEDVKLYDLTFSESSDGGIGVNKTGDIPIYVGMKVHEIPQESNMLMSMQESCNYLLDQLMLVDMEQAVPAETAEAPVDDLIIQTEIGILNFPGKWEDYLITELVDGYALEFYCSLLEHDPVLVFTVLLRSEDGDIISHITDEDGVQHTISIWIAHPEFDHSWSAAEVDMVYAMQEDMNYLLSDFEP